MSSTEIVQLKIGPMENFIYLIADTSARVCAVVDPGWEAQHIRREAQTRGWKIEKILLTHTHFDHADAVTDLIQGADIPVFVHRAEAAALPKSMTVTSTEEGSQIAVGGVSVGCLHTPGHTPGSQCFLTDRGVFTGDTLFIQGCGRVDLPGSDPAQMVQSLCTLSALDPTLVVYPGHDYGDAPCATIGELLKSNPYLNPTSESMLI